MDYNLNKTDLGTVEINVTISTVDLKTESSWAAARLAKDLKVAGFRPGKIPYDIVKRELGEMAIIEEAADKLVSDTLNEIIKKEKLEIASQPKIDIKKLAPANDFEFTATFALIPEVTLPDFSSIKISSQEIKIEEKKIFEALDNLRQMRVKEIRESRPAQTGDKVEVDFEVRVDGKIISGGKAEKYDIVIGEKQMIPGFEEELIGLQENDEKEFGLNFPANYTQELAGKKAQFKIKLRGIFKRELPEADDEFAKNVGVENLDELKSKIRENLEKKAEREAEEKQEIEMIEKITAAAKFSPISETLIETEQHRMLHELKSKIEQDGGKFEHYLEHTKKTEEELEAGFKPQAEERLKTYVIFRKIILNNQIKPSPEIVETEIKHAEVMCSQNPALFEKIHSTSYRDYVESVVLNRQVIDWLKQNIGQSGTKLNKS